ncbi:WecB/TagA/CpsF family glycosyltransferase [Rariglobus hedericola]|uniref:WecB/TagA/CpsF family glycosyltransferase n=1 Tax=Rariglobus hedericola TaxID=2597822 RepID=A0A556QQN3_9BACT|nr:WecB/TagA/CpsF family glycosyltransferase [Rariglobus hedericola]TSJ78946.1 WecB/TagA/CpsF family glycosyltransferase [Rariglobus hedericola]
MSVSPTRRVLGVDFFIGSLDDAVDHAVGVSLREKFKVKNESESDGLSLQLNLKSSSGARNARLVVAPSAPGLAVDLVKSESYREALTTADLVLTDSGFMVLLWRAFTGEKLPRHSGLKFIRAVLDRPELKQPGAVFWVMPSAEEDARNRAWLVAQGFPVTSDDVYLAPHYAAGPIHDPELVRRIEARSPRIVMLAIGGGVQERVGLMLRTELRYSAAAAVEGESLSGSSEFAPDTSALNFNLALNRTSPALRREGPSILCLGAAIAFLTGGQANIPPWADKLILGWLFRLLSNPRKFWRRYWDALSLARLLWRNRDRLPPMGT